MEVKKAPVESNARVIETLDTFIAPKKVSQWAAMITPAIKSTHMRRDDSRNRFFFHLIQSRMNPLASNIRYQTSGTASRLIKAPKTAVKPQINTIT